MAKNKALFLDRDGVICKALDPAIYNGYLTEWEQFELMPGINELLTNAKNKEYFTFVVTNQPQVAKGLLGIGDLDKIHKNMQDLFDNKINKIYHCPHRSEDKCDCRKPKPGMLLQAAKEFNLDLENSFIVGDKDKDVKCGKNAGCKTIFVKNEFYGDLLTLCLPDFIVESISEINSIV